MSTCRICKKWDEPMFKYSTRHYAHAACGLARFGAKFLDMIPEHMIGALPYRQVEKAGFMDEVMRRLIVADRRRATN